MGKIKLFIKVFVIILILGVIFPMILSSFINRHYNNKYKDDALFVVNYGINERNFVEFIKKIINIDLYLEDL